MKFIEQGKNLSQTKVSYIETCHLSTANLCSVTSKVVLGQKKLLKRTTNLFFEKPYFPF